MLPTHVRRALAAPTFLFVLGSLLAGCSAERATAPGLEPAGPRFQTAAAVATGGVVISQVYGGGGNTGATYKNDFIELFNAGTTPVALDGWSVQYASSSGTSWTNKTVLAGTIAPGGYYLVQQAAGTGAAADLPTPDATGTVNMSATAGKIALLRTSTTLPAVSCPTGGDIVDFVGFGAANCFEGTAPTAAPSNTNAVLRKNAGCTDTDQNASDFATSAPAPRSSATAPRTCAATPVPAVASVTVSPTPTTVAVGATVALIATARDANGQAITGTTFTWATSDSTLARVDAGGVVTGVAAGAATITATAPNGVAGSAAVTVGGTPSGPTATGVRVTEFHYDNDGTDAGEAIEFEGDAGGSLSGWSVVLYSGSTGSATAGQSYLAPIALSGTFGNACGGSRGVLVVDAPGLQNGDKDGFALVNAAGQVVELLSYEGSFTATNGPAAGMTSTDVGVAQATTTPLGRSLQRAGNGTWFGPYTATFGACNAATPPPPQTGIIFSGRHPATDPALPVGFQDQLFATVRDQNTGGTVQTKITWTSDTPALATVDESGVITALGEGTAIFRATTEDGTTNTYALPMHIGTVSPSARYAGNTEFGEPADADDRDDYILRYPQFTSSFNKDRNTPNWVSYNLEATHFGPEDRCDCFTFDRDLPATFPRYTTADYTGVAAINGYGIDRGHLARSADRTAASVDNAHTYYFSNIIPQASDNNQGPWAIMENHLGSVARAGDREVYVIAGVAGSKGTVKNEGKIVIPAYVWKVAVVMSRDQGLAHVRSAADVQVIAAVMPNDAGVRNVNWESYKTTIDSVEALSGYDVLAALPDAIERVVESGLTPRAPTARFTFQGERLEGQRLTFDATTSTDPDVGGPLKDALSFAWTIDGEAAGIGSTMAHTFAQDGAYQVRLIVADHFGLADTTTTEVRVANVLPTVASFDGAILYAGETYRATGRFTDPGADAWTATVSYAGTSQALALQGQAFSLSHTYATAGTYAATVSVRDDDGTGTGSASVEVRTALQGVDDLSTLLPSLGAGARTTSAGGSLDRGELRSLQLKLDAAAAQLKSGNGGAAANILNAFLEQLQEFVAAGRLTQERVAPLVTLARRVAASAVR